MPRFCSSARWRSAEDMAALMQPIEAAEFEAFVVRRGYSLHLRMGAEAMERLVESWRRERQHEGHRKGQGNECDEDPVV